MSNEIDNEHIRLSQFNEKVALDTYKMCQTNKAELWLSTLNPPKEEKKESNFGSSKQSVGVDLSSLAEL